MDVGAGIFVSGSSVADLLGLSSRLKRGKQTKETKPS